MSYRAGNIKERKKERKKETKKERKKEGLTAQNNTSRKKIFFRAVKNTN